VDWRTVAAINAKLSPQMNWFDNVTLTRTVLQTVKDNPAFTEADRDFLTRNSRPLSRPRIKNSGSGQIADIKDGQKLSDMTDEQGGAFIRSHNELAGDLQTHDHELEPTGGITGWGKPFNDLGGRVIYLS